MGFVETAETVEGGEELIVPADAGAGNEGAHGEGIDESVVELLVFEGVLGADVALTTDGLRRDAAGGATRLDQGVRWLGVDAEKIGGCILNKGLGVDGS